MASPKNMSPYVAWGGDDGKSSYVDRKSGKVKSKDKYDAWAATRKTKGGETSNVGGGWEHKKRMSEDDTYYKQVKAAKKEADKAGWGGKLKKLGGAVLNIGKMGVKLGGELATNPAGMVMLGAGGAYLAGANLAGGAGAVGTATGGGSAGLGASLHAGGSAVAPIGTAGMSAGGGAGIAGAGSAGLSTMEGGRNALSVAGKSPLGGITKIGGSMLEGIGGLKGAMAGLDAVGSIAEGFAGSADSEEAQKAANPFAKYRDTYAKRLDELYTNPESLRETPGYKFRFDEGMRALNRTSAAKGDRLSGNVLLEASRYGQGLADQMRGEEIDRLAALSGATMGFSNTGYDQRSQKVGGINEALGTLGDWAGRTNYWDNDNEEST